MPASVAACDEPWPEILLFAQLWGNAVAGTCYIPLDEHGIEQFLVGQACEMAAVLRSDRFRPEAAAEIGRRMVEASFAAPETLGRTIQMVQQHLLAALHLPSAPYRERINQLIAWLTVGFTRAVRDRVLDEQDSIHHAAQTARLRAEAALRDSESQRRHAVLHDPLTGLPNRIMFIDRLANCFNQLTPTDRVAVSALNLDRFDVVNDCLGQETGDQILLAISARLAERARRSGHLLARLGGDEFGILAERTQGPQDAAEIARTFLETVSEPVRVDGHQVTVTASMGLAEQQLGKTNTTEMIRAARMSLRWAKIDGRARWVLFDRDRGDRQVERSALSAQMPEALARGQFQLAYQPLVSLVDGGTHGVEALARWVHPTQGVIYPNRFIDLAEDTGLIVALGTELLHQACQQAAVWHRMSPSAPFVSVNLAVRQLRHPDLLHEVRRALEISGLPPQQLQLEITESAVLGTDDQSPIATLRTLANLGIRLAIDDFGTGYANFAYLRDLPVHALKLDGAFVRSLKHAGSDPAGEAIIQTMVTLGHQLGLTVTSEGVETADQAERLAEFGCDWAQGWHFGRPEGPERITQLLS